MSRQLQDSEFEAQFRQAQECSKQTTAMEMQAVEAYYDTTNQLIVVHLRSGAVFSFPPSIAQGLSGAAAEELAEVEITPSGLGLHWEKLDADFTVSGLLNGSFGTQAWMNELHKRWSQQQAS